MAQQAAIILLLTTVFFGASFSFSPSGLHPLRPWWNTPRSSSSSARIVGGYVIDIKDAPFQVALSSDHFGHFCGGSLLSERWVLTAGHCASEWSNNLLVRVGSNHHASGGKLIKVKKVHQHPQYHPITIDYDFSLLELEKAVQFSDKVRPVELPEKDEAVAEGTCLQVSGWGSTQSPSESSDVLRATNVPTLSLEGCSRAYEATNAVTDRMLCAGYTEGGKDACHGDSGGPLVEGNKLVGVVSWGTGCAEPGYPGVYARVAAVRDWVREVSGV